MGDVADAMIEGFLCECCGTFIDGEEPGYPRYCSPQCARDRGASPEPSRKSKKKAQKPYQHSSMRKRDAAWLRLSAAEGAAGYLGVQWDMCPSAFHRLKRLGFVEGFTPHNPAHKDRAVATEAGHAKLAELDGEKGNSK